MKSCKYYKYDQDSSDTISLRATVKGAGYWE